MADDLDPKPQVPDGQSDDDLDVSALLEQAGLIKGSARTPRSPAQRSFVQALSEESAQQPEGRSVVIDELGERVGEGESREGYTESDETLRQLAHEQGMEYVNLDEIELDKALIDFLPANIPNTYKVFPVRREPDGTIVVALADPLNVRTLDDLELLLNCRVRGAVAREEAILRHIEDYYVEAESVNDILESFQQSELDLTVDEKDFSNLEDIANQPPIIKLVNLLLLQALKERASDLHVEPYQNSFRIRYRVDGTLHETVPPPRHLQNAIVSRLKVMSGMNIAERRLPQDGRISLSMQGRSIDLRVSCLPTVNGESLVMRILDRSMMMIGLENIGMMPAMLQRFDKVIRKPHGIILVTGPTGSGKTTTLYAVLQKIYTPERKFITVEEPVEYELEGVVQVNINTAAGLTFARCLRSILRQDPDVIMVGEIRDQETAQIAIEASLTGHLVLSTLHTNDAPSTLTRLIDMDLEPFLITSTLEAVLAQRLVRIICEECKEPYQPDEEAIREMGFTMDQVRDITFYRGAGCAECNYIGYRGRVGIFELLVPSAEIRELVLQRAPSSVIARKAIEQGMRTLRQDGWEKVIRGFTTVEEILREA